MISPTSTFNRRILGILLCIISIAQWENFTLTKRYTAAIKEAATAAYLPANNTVAVSTSESNNSSSNDNDDFHKAFHLALSRARQRSEKSRIPLFANLTQLSEIPVSQSSSNSSLLQRSTDGKLLNLIRIPKAGSSALSITARALVGCFPDGFPCCDNIKNDTNLNKACPRRDLFCPAIRNCVDHRGTYSDDLNELTITSIRHPVARALSAFFYHPPHRPVGKCRTFDCFHGALRDFQFKDPMTKMLNGYHAYSLKEHIDQENKPISVQQAKWRLCNMHFFGITELPIASALLLYDTRPFHQLEPNPVAFGLPPRNVVNDHFREKRPRASVNLARKNSNAIYARFKTTVFMQQNGSALVEQYHPMDMVVYDFAIKLFCQRLFAAPERLVQAATRAGLAKHFVRCREILQKVQEQQAQGESNQTSGEPSSNDLCHSFLGSNPPYPASSNGNTKTLKTETIGVGRNKLALSTVATLPQDRQVALKLAQARAHRRLEGKHGTYSFQSPSLSILSFLSSVLWSQQPVCNKLILHQLYHSGITTISIPSGNEKQTNNVTTLAHPVSDALDSFFCLWREEEVNFPPSTDTKGHRRRPCNSSTIFECFRRDYVFDQEFQNPMSNMLVYGNNRRHGDASLNSTVPSLDNFNSTAVQIAKARLCAMNWFGIKEVPVVSVLLLYETEPFSQLEPDPLAFGLPPPSDETQPETLNNDENQSVDVYLDEYARFKNTTYTTFLELNGPSLVERFNQDDLVVYTFAVNVLCERAYAVLGLVQAIKDAGLVEHITVCQKIKRQQQRRQRQQNASQKNKGLCEAVLGKV